jgi:hypothetical protein
MKDQPDVTCYFISLTMRSTCFGHSYIHHQEFATVLLNYHIGRLVLSLLCVGDLVLLVLSGARFAGCASAFKTSTFFFNHLTHSRFHPSLSLLITYYSYKPFP